jgi:hypothetical protein
MTAISDRATVSLALEVASTIVPHNMATGDSLQVLLGMAEQILLWHDKMCAERAKRDSVRVNAPKIELHPSFAGS